MIFFSLFWTAIPIIRSNFIHKNQLFYLLWKA